MSIQWHDNTDHVPTFEMSALLRGVLRSVQVCASWGRRAGGRHQAVRAAKREDDQ